MPDDRSIQTDVQAIQALNAQDAKAVLESDIDTITSQWSDDIVVLSEGLIVRGRAANVAIAEKSRQLLEAIEPIAYVTDFEEIQVCGDYAYEWGTFHSSMRRRSGGETVSHRGKLMRILQRQDNGTWKMHRTILVMDRS
jgi:ketosteroid isomerase-like protein